MRLNWRLELPQWILIAAMFALAATVWPTAPDTMPIHWNLRGEVDGWGGKFAGLLLLPLMALGLYLLLLLLPRIDPRRASYARFAGAYAVMRFALTAFLVAVYVVTVLAALNRPVDVGSLISFLAGGLLVVLGLVLPKVQPNWFVGIRTPWTLSSRLSWEKTHRVGGWVFVVMGLAVALTGLLQTGWAFAAMMLIVLGGTLGLVVYSYFVWRDDPDKMPWNGQSGR
jgi:uncharacterized membrane protein